MKTSRFFLTLLYAIVVLSAGAAIELRAADVSPIEEQNVSIEIHHCTTCGFLAKAEQAAAEIKKELGFESTLVIGKVGSFDVFINGTLLFSKKETGRFPNPGEIVQKIKDYLDNAEDRQ